MREEVRLPLYFSLIESAKANGLNTYAYLPYIMRKLPLIDLRNKVELLKLLPHHVNPGILEKYLN